jgi:hypothetical protein
MCEDFIRRVACHQNVLRFITNVGAARTARMIQPQRAGT